MSELNLEQIAIHKWIHENGFVNEQGQQISYHDHFFLYDIMTDWSPVQVIKKAAQIGMSVGMNLKAMYAAMSLRFRFNVIYTLPSDSDVWEFVPTKTDKIIMSNSAIRDIVKTDKVEMKEVQGRFIHFKGTRSKTAPIMTTADLLIHDEFDRSDQNIIEQYESRVGRSKFKGIWYLSNPSVINAGVDRYWKISDRKEWFVTCPTCMLEQVLTFDGNIDLHSGEYVCRQCRDQFDKGTRRDGKWVATNPEGKISGYHISQLMAPWISAREIIAQKETKPADYFYNFVLGEPVALGEMEDFRRLILDAWTPRSLDKEPFFMGIDVGRIKHWVLGNAEGIFRIGTCESRQEIETLIDRYNPFVVIDGGPERTWAEEFRKKYPRLWLNFYSRDREKKDIARKSEKNRSGIILSDRNRIIDATVDDIATGEILFSLPTDQLERYISHWNCMVKVEEVDRQGNKRFVWDKNSDTAQDHWVHATVYYKLARMRAGKGEFVPGPAGRKKARFIQTTKEGFRMSDLEEYLGEKKQ